MEIKKNGEPITASKRVRIYGADEDDDVFGFGGGGEGEIAEENLGESIDDLSTAVEDMEEAVEDVHEDDIDIELDNNITNHYIAECDGCGGIFISAMIESDQVVESINGTCPLCERDTEQFLKWVVRDVE
jgi:hypothetical protein